MALVVEDGTGLANAESYLSLADADAYFTSKRGDPAEYGTADWLAAATTTAIKEACLRWATRLLDLYWDYDGEKSTTVQALRWPRTYATDIEGEEIDGDTIPLDLGYATAEMARALLLDAERLDDQEGGLASLKVDVISLVFDKIDRPSKLPGLVRAILSSFGRPRNGRSRETTRA